MHSTTESTFISHEVDKIGGTQLSLDERAEDKNEDEDGTDIPPPLFKKCPEDNGEGSRSPATLEKMAAISVILLMCIVSTPMDRPYGQPKGASAPHTRSILIKE